MKKLLLAIVLVLAMAIPAFAQNGPVKIKPLMIYAEISANQATPIYYVGFDQEVTLRRHWEIKGTGSFKEKVEIWNGARLVWKSSYGPYNVDYATFSHYDGFTSFSIDGIFKNAGYYTLKCTYRDVATGNTWSQQTKIHVLE